MTDALVTAPPSVEAFDLRRLPAAFYDDPYPTYHALRNANPVFRLPDGGFFLTRYADVLAVYKDVQTFSSDKTIEFKPKYGDSPLYEHHTTSLVFNDPPLHTRVRRLLIGALTQKAIERMEAGLVARVDHLLGLAQARGRIDLIDDFASAIPIEIIGNLLGVPHDERDSLRDWSLAILGALEPAPSAEQLARGNRAVLDFVEYLKGLVARRRAHAGNPDTDVLTRLIEGEPEGGRLTEKELLQNCIFILNAGHETTTNLIGNGLVLLARFPEQRRLLRDDPSLVRSAVEEILRFESSNQLGNRISTCAARIGDTEIGPSVSIHLGIGAANRDPVQFPDPDRFDIRRHPNRHLAFGSGIHQCAGMSLARLEGQIAIGRFLARFPDYVLDGAPVRGQRARFRGFVRVPCRVTP